MTDRKPCPICSEWRYISLVKVCPICGAPGKSNEVRDTAEEFLRQWETAITYWIEEDHKWRWQHIVGETDAAVSGMKNYNRPFASEGKSTQSSF